MEGIWSTSTAIATVRLLRLYKDVFDYDMNGNT